MHIVQVLTKVFSARVEEGTKRQDQGTACGICIVDEEGQEEDPVRVLKDKPQERDVVCLGNRSMQEQQN